MKNNTPQNEGQDKKSVSISYYQKDSNIAPVTKDFELLIVACDPRYIAEDFHYLPAESEIFQKLTNFQFHTSLLKVKDTADQKYTVIFSPHDVQQMQGDVYAFRNETSKQFGIVPAQFLSENLITVYQIADPGKDLWPASKFEEQLKANLPAMKKAGWWPYDAEDYEVIQTVTTPYFNHFKNEDIKAGILWELLDLQGQNQTIYVHASTCFESIVDCWGYANLLMQKEQVLNALPTDLDAPIAVLGAGASGLLYSLRLRKLGYTNITILESTDRHGGKTHTVEVDKSGPDMATTYCELGACYLSPSYDAMVDALSDYTAGNKRVNFTQTNPNFRGVFTGDSGGPVIGYEEYVLKCAEAATGDGKDLTELILAKDLVKYSYLYYTVMGNSNPMPLSPPQDFLDQYGSYTFSEFLKYHDLRALTGLLQYAYQVQGYGSIDRISAFYGLIWITPQIMLSILYDALAEGLEYLNIADLKPVPLLTCWSKGWEDVWDQIVTKEKLKIKYNTVVTKIIRS